ncbi:hypothetical protein KRM28CT15_64740 [Krasilnikovia sp. M28-CT-15]
MAHYWIVTWDLRGQDPYRQQVLPYPAVNMTFKPGRCRIAGVPRRHRLHEAAARAARGSRLDLVALAAELGYSDQAHLTRDFTSIVGQPPAQYVQAQ